jgi:hypothetical protein
MEGLLGASLVVVGFVVLAHFVGLIPKTAEVLARTRESIAVLKDPQLDDDSKERHMQQNAIVLFKLLGLLLLGSAVALLTPFAIIWLADIAGLLSLDSSIDMLLRWDFLLGATVIGFAAYYGLRRFGR